MIPLTNEEKKYIMSKKFLIHAKKDLVLMMTIKNTIAILQENIEELLMISATEDIKYQKNPCRIS